MANSFEAVADQAKQLTMLCTQQGATIVRETNKRIIAMCGDEHKARYLVNVLKANGWAYPHIAKGLKSDRYYVDAYFNYPY